MIEFWHWWVAAVVFACVELLAPGVVFLWLAVAAALVGFLLLAFPLMIWQVQALSFALLAVASVLAGRAIYRRTATPTDETHLNRRAEQYVGTLHTLETPIVNGHGRAFVDDASWSVEGPDLPAGTTVRVIGADGAVLKVSEP